VLSVKQALVVATLNYLPPWKVSTLALWDTKKPLSVRSAIAALEAHKVFFWVAARDVTLLQDLQKAKNPVAAWKLWANAQPSKATLESLSKIFKIVFITHDRRKMLIRGTIGSLTLTNPSTGEPVQPVPPVKPPWVEKAQALVSIVAGSIALFSEEGILVNILGAVEVSGGQFDWVSSEIEHPMFATHSIMDLSNNPQPISGTNYLPNPSQTTVLNVVLDKLGYNPADPPPWDIPITPYWSFGYTTYNMKTPEPVDGVTTLPTITIVGVDISNMDTANFATYLNELDQEAAMGANLFSWPAGPPVPPPPIPIPIPIQ
jgi:hypothetical protein